MRSASGWIGAALAFAASPALAGAWALPPGEGQAILKYEGATADEAYDANGSSTALPHRRDGAAVLFVERGLTRRFTVQGKLSYGGGVDNGVHYDGAGPAELGLRAQIYRSEKTAVSLYAGGIFGGQGRNASYAAPGVGGQGSEFRLLMGRSGKFRKWPGFTEVQYVRIELAGLPAELRIDSTIGLEPYPGWLLLVQTYSGEAGQSRWSKAEVGVAAPLGRDLKVQLGYRAVTGGQNISIERGPILGLWKKF